MDEDEKEAPAAGVEAVSADASAGRVDVAVQVTGVEATMAEIVKAMSDSAMSAIKTGAAAAMPRDDG